MPELPAPMGHRYRASCTLNIIMNNRSFFHMIPPESGKIDIMESNIYVSIYGLLCKKEFEEIK